MLPFVPRRIWNTREFEPPWQNTEPSILEYLKAQGDVMEEVRLPDAPQREKGKSLTFVPGALDNLLGQPEGNAADICKAVTKVLKHPNAPNIEALYRTLLDEDAISVVDGAIDIFAETPPDWERLAIFFEWLASHSPDREPVKFAIAMLGISGRDFTDLFLTFGAHEEFTKYAAVALANSLPPEEARAAQAKLARRVRGWGRIDLVERLAHDADAAFRHWLVRDGYKNSIMYEYLACIAAREGRLLEQLQASGAKDDVALLDGAAEIFEALVNGGPAEDMGDYTLGAEAAELWFDLIADAPATLVRGSAAQKLAHYAKRDAHPWREEAAATIGLRAVAYIARPELHELVRRNLHEGSRTNYWYAKTLAPDVGIDLWPIIFDRQHEEADGDYWHDLMQTEDAQRIDKVTTLAIDRLPLVSMASGPALEHGLGPDWKDHSALNYIVQDLKNFPGKGWKLIATSLRSPIIRNRNMGIKALASWSKSDWPTEALPLVRRAIQDEPDPKVKERLKGLLQPEATD